VTDVLLSSPPQKVTAQRETVGRLLRPTKIEFALVVVILYLSSTARLPFVSSATEDDPGTFMVVVRGMGYVVTALLLAAYYKHFITGASHVAPIVLLAVLSLASVRWSISPESTTFQSVVLLGMTALGIYIGSRFDGDGIVALIRTTVLFVVILTAVVVLLTPEFGGRDGYAWRGVFVHKNLLGQTMAIGALAWGMYGLSTVRYRFLNLAMAGACIAIMVLSNSATSAIALAAAFASIPALRLGSRRPIGALGVLGMAILAFQFGSANLERIVGAIVNVFGRDSTFTGRTRVWEKALEAINDRPLLGYGHSAFWGNPRVAAEMEREIWWSPPTAHNGYLDILLSIGVIGLILFALSIGTTMLYALKLASQRNDLISLFPATYVVFVLVYNSSESITGTQPTVAWILYVAISVSVVMHLHDHDSRRMTNAS
jgi:exopolysaccharide production protein ExoQ